MVEATTEQEALDAYSTIVTSVAEQVLPSVASLRIGRGGRGFGGAGSGVVITPDGFLVTSAHVVAAGGTASASFIDGTEHDVDVVGADPLSDLAIVRARTDTLHPVRIGNADQLRVGQLVVAIGNPMGFSGSVTSGVVSGLGRSLATADGNVIVSVGDVGVRKAGDLQRLMVEAKIGSRLALEVMRGDQIITRTVVPVELS